MRKYKFQTKILFTNIAALVCVVIFCLLMFLFYYTNENQKQFEKSTEGIADSAASILEDRFFFADNTAIQLINNPYIKDVLNKLYFEEDKGNYFDHEYTEASEISQYLMPYLVKQDMIYRICFYNENGDFMSCGSSVTSGGVKKYIGEERLNHMIGLLETHKGIKAELVYEEDVLQNTEFKTDGYISIVRPVRDSNIRNGEPFGYLEVQLSLNGIEEQLDSIIENGNIEVLQEDTKVLNAGNAVETGKGFTIKRELDNHFQLILTSWNEGRIQIIFVTILILIFISAFIIISMVMIQRRIILKITKPLISLFNFVQTRSLNEVSQLDEESPIDEIQELQKSFNEMMKSLQNSVETMVVMRTEKMNAQMLALQAQVDPHFIHNTLAIISSLSDEGEHQKVKDVSNMLSSMIRYSSDYSSQKTLLIREIDNIRSYLKLLEYRYEEDFTYEVKTEKECEQIPIPKFILQPPVENALKHSLKQADFPWKIVIESYLKNGKWYIKVSDNGAGIDEKNVVKIKKQVQEINESSMDDLLKHLKIGGFSLINILIRMYIHYQEDMEFDIYKNNENGTTVILGGNIND